MINLKQLLGLCEHRWKHVSTTNVYDISYGRSKNPEYRIWVLQCEKCGKIKKKKV